MAYEILVCDIDGTIVNHEKIITPKTKETLMRLQENGQKLVLASGRSEYGFQHLADELKMDDYGSYILSFNGGKITNYHTKEVIYNAFLPVDIIKTLHQAAVEHQVGILGYDKATLISGNGINQYVRMDAEICYMDIKEVEDFPGYFKNLPLNKCLMCGEPDQIRQLEQIMRERVGERIGVYRSESHFLELMPKGVDKAYSLSRLLAYLGLSRKQMVCCGDGYNDVSMIRYAGLGVAMANAKEEVKRNADTVTSLTNDEDGIVEIVKKYFDVEL